MNCECTYRIRTERGADTLAKRIANVEGEIYPISLARVLVDVRVSKDIDYRYGYGGSEITFKKGQLILFAGGKLHRMYSLTGYTPYFPQDIATDWFEDIKEYNLDGSEQY